MPIGFGIFMWSSPERRTRRYGMVYPSESTFGDKCTCDARLDIPACQQLIGKRVRMSCHVVDARQSGHAGDAFLGILPSTPQVGETIELGVGVFCMEPSEFSYSKWAIGIRPSSGRERFWIDPRILFRLHDQTVEFMVDETTDPESPDPSGELHETNTNSVISNGDGTFQMVYRPEDTPVTVLPRIERLEPGLLSMTPPSATGNRGESFPID